MKDCYFTAAKEAAARNRFITLLTENLSLNYNHILCLGTLRDSCLTYLMRLEG